MKKNEEMIVTNNNNYHHCSSTIILKRQDRDSRSDDLKEPIKRKVEDWDIIESRKSCACLMSLDDNNNNKTQQSDDKNKLLMRISIPNFNKNQNHEHCQIIDKYDNGVANDDDKTFFWSQFNQDLNHTF